MLAKKIVIKHGNKDDLITDKMVHYGTLKSAFFHFGAQNHSFQRCAVLQLPLLLTIQTCKFRKFKNLSVNLEAAGIDHQHLRVSC